MKCVIPGILSHLHISCNVQPCVYKQLKKMKKVQKLCCLVIFSVFLYNEVLVYFLSAIVNRASTNLFSGLFPFFQCYYTVSSIMQIRLVQYIWICLDTLDTY